MNPLHAALVAILFATPVFAAEPEGCGAFAWDLRDEQRLLGDTTKPALGSGAEVSAAAPVAFELRLKPHDAADLPKPPERAPKASSSFAGYATIRVPNAGTYKVTLSREAWIDVVAGGAYLKPAAFSGATPFRCPRLLRACGPSTAHGTSAMTTSTP